MEDAGGSESPQEVPTFVGSNPTPTPFSARANCVIAAIMFLLIRSTAKIFDCHSLKFIPLRIEVTSYSSAGLVIRKKSQKVSLCISIVCLTDSVSTFCEVKKSNRR